MASVDNVVSRIEEKLIDAASQTDDLLSASINASGYHGHYMRNQQGEHSIRFTISLPSDTNRVQSEASTDYIASLDIGVLSESIFNISTPDIKLLTEHHQVPTLKAQHYEIKINVHGSHGKKNGFAQELPNYVDLPVAAKLLNTGYGLVINDKEGSYKNRIFVVNEDAANGVLIAEDEPESLKDMMSGPARYTISRVEKHLRRGFHDDIGWLKAFDNRLVTDPDPRTLTRGLVYQQKEAIDIVDFLQMYAKIPQSTTWVYSRAKGDNSYSADLMVRDNKNFEWNIETYARSTENLAPIVEHMKERLDKYQDLRNSELKLPHIESTTYTKKGGLNVVRESSTSPSVKDRIFSMIRRK